MLCFLSPITWSVLRLFGLSVTYVVTALVFWARSGGISFCHPFIHYSSINRPLQPSGLIAGYGGTVSQWRVSSIYQFCHITNGVFCHWCEQSMMRAIPLKRPSTLGCKKRPYQRPAWRERYRHLWSTAGLNESQCVSLQILSYFSSCPDMSPSSKHTSGWSSKAFNLKNNH